MIRGEKLRRIRWVGKNKTGIARFEVYLVGMILDAGLWKQRFLFRNLCLHCVRIELGAQLFKE